MLKIIEAFQKDAKKIGEDENSVEQLKMWVESGIDKTRLREPEELNKQWSRKPVSIDNIRELDRMTPGEEGNIAGFLDNLQTYPIEEVIHAPEEEFLDEFMEPMDNYFILETADGRKLLVSTEGNNYARYVVKLPKGW
jgi:hypothetical protein